MEQLEQWILTIKESHLLIPESVISHQKIGFLSGFFNIYTSWFINRL